jgi:hypothetical protein
MVDLSNIQFSDSFKSIPTAFYSNANNFSQTFSFANPNSTPTDPPSFYDGTFITAWGDPDSPRQTFNNRTGLTDYSSLNTNWTWGQ